MAPDTAPLPDVYSANELARAAGVPASQVRALIRQATIPTIDGALVTLGDAVQTCRALRHGRLTASPSAAGIGLLSPTQNGSARSGQTTGGSLLVSGSAPGAVLAVLLVMTIASAPNAGLEPPGSTLWPCAARVRGRTRPRRRTGRRRASAPGGTEGGRGRPVDHCHDAHRSRRRGRRRAGYGARSGCRGRRWNRLRAVPSRERERATRTVARSRP